LKANEKLQDRPKKKRAPAKKTKDDFIGRLTGVFKVVGDIESPADPPDTSGRT
jgi:hypothetical protein